MPPRPAGLPRDQSTTAATVSMHRQWRSIGSPCVPHRLNAEVRLLGGCFMRMSHGGSVDVVALRVPRSRVAARGIPVFVGLSGAIASPWAPPPIA